MNHIIQYPGDANRPFQEFRYPGGEVQVRLNEDYAIRLKNPIIESVIVVARITNGDIIPVAQLLNAIRGTTSVDIKLVLPYLPYGRADRRFTIGDSCGLQAFAQLMNTFAGVEIITLDAHSNKAKMLLRKPFIDVSPMPIIDQVIDRCDGSAVYGSPIMTSDVLLPDEGAANRYKISSPLIASKVRDPETGKLSGFEVPGADEFKCDNILIVDDICDGGGTFIGIAESLRKVGVQQDLFLYVTHGIFSKTLSPLKQYFKHVYTTDSFKVKESYGEPDFLTVLPCLPTIMENIK